MDATSTGGAGQLRLRAANGQPRPANGQRHSEGSGEAGSRPAWWPTPLPLIQEHKAGQAPAPSWPSSPPLEAEQAHLLEEVGPVVSKWSEATRDTRRFAAWMKASPEVDLGPDSHWADVQAGLARCAEQLEFRKVLSGPLAGTTRLFAGMFCQHRTICRMCAIRRSAKILQAYVPKLTEAVASMPKGGRLVFVTLTVRDGASLDDRLAELQGGLSRLVGHCRKVRQRAAPHALKAIAGGVFSVEMKRGAGSKLWHPHAHGLLVCDRSLDFTAVKRVWWATMGYRAVSHLKNVQAGPDGLLGASLECFKYATKFEGLANRDRLEVFGSAFGRRLLRSFGSLRGVVVPEDLADAPLDWESLEWVRLLLRYRDGSFVPAAASGASSGDGGRTFAIPG